MPRLAKSLETLREQVNALAPKRSKRDDGWIGDAAHAARASDHNPNKKGVVQAIDITHDPKNGMDAHALAETLRLNRDRRIKYVISNGRIFSSSTKPWEWRKYAGSNPHSRHVHISVGDIASYYDDPAAWKIGAKPAPVAPPPDLKPPPPHVERPPQPPAPEATKPAVKSKSIWAALGTFIVSAGGALTDWKVAAVVVVGLLAAFLIWDRMKRPDIFGIFR